MTLEFVGGPNCGETRNVQALPASIETTHKVGSRCWIVTYRRTGERTVNKAYRYIFAGQRDLVPVSAV